MNKHSVVNADNDEDVFEDSSLLANFEESYKDISVGLNFDKSGRSNKIGEDALDVSALCCDEEISGYDKLTGRTWIYPTNYPVRDYQFNMIQAALLNNTLVSLPTGLGKTLVAAVVMYNFYRWYPLGAIVFAAPTRPLVAQQIAACYNIVAIPPADTVEMTGHMQVNTRKQHWQTKRVFFATPQVIYNDLRAGICPAHRIRCLVLDEAHRARGNYAYCQIVSALTDMGHKTYRVLALSATPGSKVDDVVAVVKNLHIAHLELRTESCPDVARYSHARSINTWVVPLDKELSSLREHYVQIVDGYARRLKQLSILPHNVGNLSKGRLVMLYKEFQGTQPAQRHPQHAYIMKDFTVLIALYHGLELLTRHGARVFLAFFDDHPERGWMQRDDRLTGLLERLRDDLGPSPMDISCSVLPDGTVPQIPKEMSFGHPKFAKLKEIVVEHFTRARTLGQDTRAIVFCEYRESVQLVYRLLLQCRPLVSPRAFVGQAANVSQKQQLRVMREFVSGVCDVLVATCVAEEGLDVGAVDLIVCFDVSTRSPVRLVQRCGRTGRSRGGQVHILVTEGREHQTLLDCMRQRDGLNKKILSSREVARALYLHNPRMMPHGHTPTPHHMFLTVPPVHSDNTLKGQKDLRTMLVGRTSSSSSHQQSPGAGAGADLIARGEFSQLYPGGLAVPRMFTFTRRTVELSYMDKEKALAAMVKKCSVNLSRWSECWPPSGAPQPAVNTSPSLDSRLLASVLRLCHHKRSHDVALNTQHVATPELPQPLKSASPNKQKPTKKKQKVNPNAKKDGDIRALFSTATKSTKCYTNLIKDIGTQVENVSTALLNLFVDLNLNADNKKERCLICDNVCDCSVLQGLRNCEGNSPQNISILVAFLKEPKLPDIDLLDEITLQSIDDFKINDESKIIDNDQNNVAELTKIKGNNDSNNFDLIFDFESPFEENVETDNLDTFGNNFNIGDIEDVFVESSPEIVGGKYVIEKDFKQDIIQAEKEPSAPKETLGFFGLDSIDDIFEDSCEIIETSPKSPKNKQKDSPLLIPANKSVMSQGNSQKPATTIENPGSPSILSGKVKANVLSTSPILCSQVRKVSLSIKNDKMKTSTPQINSKRKLSYNVVDYDEFAIPNTPLTSKQEQSVTHSGNKSLFTITQLVDMINKTNNTTSDTTNVSLEINPFNEFVERSTSPILFTQADVKRSSFNNSLGNKMSATQSKKNESLIILESDSESDDNTQIYELESDKIKHNSDRFKSPLNIKRKYESDEDDKITPSPFFSKRQKICDNNSKPLTLQEKVLAALSRSTSGKPNNMTLNFISTQISSQKENRNPQFTNNHMNFIKHRDNECENTQIKSPKSQKVNSIEASRHSPKQNTLEMLQILRRDNKTTPVRSKLIGVALARTKSEQNFKRKQDCVDNDDDFVDDFKNCFRSQNMKNGAVSEKPRTKHKARKERRAHNSLLDLEADQSDDWSHSGDELSDDSVGSIADFICDDPPSVHHDDTTVDMQAHYMRSVKSPVNGMFKIPCLPQQYVDRDVLSQAVEEDAYEMDSFCVDSHVGLTQANDMSELELAEIALEERRRRKPKVRTKLPNEEDSHSHSPVVRSKRRNVKRRLESDSDDSL